MKKKQKSKEKIPEEETGRRKRPSVILCMMIFDLVLICAASACMYRCHMLEHTVKASEMEESKVRQQQSDAVGESFVQLSMNENNDTTKELLEHQAKEIYRKTPELLVLVNAGHGIPDDYKVSLMTIRNQQRKAAESMVPSLEKMLEDGEKAGYSFCVVSAYRNAAYQKRVIENDIQRYISRGMSKEAALQLTLEQVLPAGYSEHETGLAADITARSYTGLEKDQEQTPDNQWMRENCWKYGFIVRYPDNKTSVTGISYEPWHFRYVGKEAAAFLRNNNMTLEEFWELIES